MKCHYVLEGAKGRKKTLVSCYLVQVGQAVGVLAQSLVLASQSVPGRNFTKFLQIDNIESTERNTDREGAGVRKPFSGSEE